MLLKQAKIIAAVLSRGTVHSLEIPIPRMQKRLCEWTSVSCASVQTISKYFIETALLPLSPVCIEGLRGKGGFKRT